jgi:hypothetical protein
LHVVNAEGWKQKGNEKRRRLLPKHFRGATQKNFSFQYSPVLFATATVTFGKIFASLKVHSEAYLVGVFEESKEERELEVFRKVEILFALCHQHPLHCSVFVLQA